MDILQYTSDWTKGDAIQGKIMLLAGAIFLVAGIFIFINNHTILKGTLIPLGLLLVILFGYGGFLSFSRPSHLTTVETGLKENAVSTIQTEYDKSMNDHKAYSNLKIVWCFLIAGSALFYYFAPSDYFKGLSIGLVTLFLTAMIVDTCLHHRLIQYISGLEIAKKDFK